VTWHLAPIGCFSVCTVSPIRAFFLRKPEFVEIAIILKNVWVGEPRISYKEALVLAPIDPPHSH
jgi:hypothetical protein